MRAIPAGALGYGVDEFLVRPGAYAGLLIGSDIGRKDVSERRLDWPPAGESVTTAGTRVASGAVADDRQVAAALDLFEVLFVDITGDGAAGRERRQCHAAKRSAHCAQ